jgi:hypothetical protein
MNCISLRRAGVSVAFAACVMMSIVGCPEKKAPVVLEAAPPPPPPSAPTVTELAPLIDDAGADADADAAPEAEAPKKRPWTAPLTANQAKIKACCSAMRTEAKQLANSPEGYQLRTMADQCDMFVAQLGPQGSAPELSQFREVLKNIKLPSACQF